MLTRPLLRLPVLAVLLSGCAPAMGTLTVVAVDRLGTPVPEAQVSIAGAPACRVPCTRDLPPGSVRLEVTAPGATHAETITTPVVSERDRRVQVVFRELPQLPDLPPLRAGTVAITLATPGARVEALRLVPSIEHKDVTAALGDGSQALRVNIPADELWTLIAEKEGYTPFVKHLLFERDGDVVPVDITLEPITEKGTIQLVPFSEGMTPPKRVAGMDPQYTREAMEAHQEGKVIARCVITTLGFLVACRIIKSEAPLMSNAVLRALATHRYMPVTYQGHVQAVSYTLTFRFRMP